MVQRSEIGAEVVKPSLFPSFPNPTPKVSPTPSRTTTPKWPFESVTGEEGGKGEEFQYVFDITPCFSPEHMFDFRVAFPVDTSTVETDNNIKDLVQQVRQEIQIAAQITPIRVQNVMVDFTKDHMYAIATLVDFPIYLSQYL